MPTDTATRETRAQYPPGTTLWKPWMEEVRLRQATNIDEVTEFLEQGESYDRICWDLETDRLEAGPENIVGHSIAFHGKEGLYIPVRHKQDKDQNLDPQQVWDVITKAIEPPKRLLVYNWKFEGSILARGGIYRPSLWNILEDVMIYVWLDDSNSKEINLKDSAKRYLNCEMTEIQEVPGCKRGKRKSDIDFSYTSPEDATLYAASDVVMTLRLSDLLHDDVLKRQRFIVMMEHQLIDTLFMMEDNPVTIDRAFLTMGGHDLQRYASLVATQIYEAAGYNFNVGSNKEVGDFLTQKLGLKDLPLTESRKAVATGSDVIEKYAEEHPVVAQILLWRSLIKERSTYVLPLLKATEKSPTTHFKIKSVGAPTGRFSSGNVEEGENQYADMNVQSVPGADAYQPAPARRVKNPPIQEMEARLLIPVMAEEGAGLFDSDD
jgi:DNA polymerase I